MLLDFFKRDEFKEFYSRSKRLRRLINLVQNEFLIEHFIELRAHLKKIRKLILVIADLFEKEYKKIELIDEPKFKKTLEIEALELQNNLKYLSLLNLKAIDIIEYILKIRVNEKIKNEKNQLGSIINDMIYVIEKIKKQAQGLESLYNEAREETDKKLPIKAQAITLTGKLGNGWSLNRNIQPVINALGGRVEPTHGGQHPYKIILPGYKIPLAASTPPQALVKEVSNATRMKPNVIVNSFNKGRLIAL